MRWYQWNDCVKIDLCEVVLAAWIVKDFSLQNSFWSDLGTNRDEARCSCLDSVFSAWSNWQEVLIRDKNLDVFLDSLFVTEDVRIELLASKAPPCCLVITMIPPKAVALKVGKTKANVIFRDHYLRVITHSVIIEDEPPLLVCVLPILRTGILGASLNIGDGDVVTKVG